MLFQVVLMSMAVGVGLCSLRWSLDTPVLRRAWRKRQLSLTAKIGLMTVLALAIRFVRMYGEGVFNTATIVGGLFFVLAGTVVVFFCEFVAQDVREVFWLVARRFSRGRLEVADSAQTLRGCSAPVRGCQTERSCSAVPQPCGARGITSPWRPAESPRKRQHR